MRAFLCIELDKGAEKECSKIIQEINSINLLNANFVKQENLHLTLKFLGEINEEQLEEIKNSLGTIEFEKFDVELGNLGFFPDVKFIKVLWLELLSENNKIIELKKLIDILLGEFSQEKNNFQSHITLARIKNITNKQEFFEKIKQIKYEKIKFQVDSLVLKQSELTPEGPIYKDLMRVKLR